MKKSPQVDDSDNIVPTTDDLEKLEIPPNFLKNLKEYEEWVANYKYQQSLKKSTQADDNGGSVENYNTRDHIENFANDYKRRPYYADIINPRKVYKITGETVKPRLIAKYKPLLEYPSVTKSEVQEKVRSIISPRDKAGKERTEGPVSYPQFVSDAPNLPSQVL